MKTLEGEWQFLVNLMFRRLGKFDGPIVREGGGKRHIYGRLAFGMSIGLHIWERAVYSGGILPGFYGIPVLKA